MGKYKMMEMNREKFSQAIETLSEIQEKYREIQEEVKSEPGKDATIIQEIIFENQIQIDNLKALFINFNIEREKRRKAFDLTGQGLLNLN